ncbi:MAG TPA: capsule assembly Wzi family protein [Bryobacteraceae bacterium]|nr:capsule assembly Wzi family protein [Bryobacteraceae bacterium]
MQIGSGRWLAGLPKQVTLKGNLPLRQHIKYRVLVIFLCFCIATRASEKAHAGPVYVPLDSWVYPAMKRLAAMGYAPDEEQLTQPWTREQCAMLVEEAEDIATRHSTKISAGRMNGEALQLIAALKAEFPDEIGSEPSVQVESVYTRFTQINGQPVRDSYHFGQTLANDYGRPYGEGANAINGFSAFGAWGRFSGYFRGEYQNASDRPPYDQNVQNFIGAIDGVPARSAVGLPSTSRFDPLEMYVGVNLPGFDATFGKQSLAWGPGEDSGFHFSNNAEPMYMLRLSQRTPLVLPGPLRYLGHIRTQFLVGRLTGHAFPPKPFINAQKITFQLTEDFEVGFTRSSIFGGVGHPLTAASIARSFFSNASTGSTAFGSSNDPGDRRSGFDFVLHVPGLKRYLSIYSDSLADDEPNPLAGPRRSAWGPGLYVTEVPGLRRLDFRFETYSTWLYRGDPGGGFFYWNDQYRDAYTNDGNLFGSWVGRDARSYAASSTYWWSAKNKVTANYRQTKTGSEFLPGGGTQTDVSLNAQWQLHANLLGAAFVQYERYFVPVLGGPRTDVAAGFGFTFYPKRWVAATR